MIEKILVTTDAFITNGEYRLYWLNESFIIAKKNLTGYKPMLYFQSLEIALLRYFELVKE